MNRKEFAILSIITLLSVIIWLVFDILHAKESTVITPVQKQQVLPLTPTFDNDIIRQLKSREE